MAVGGWLRRRRSGLFDTLVAAGVAGLTGLGIFMRETPSNRMDLGYAMAVAILFRRRWPLSTMAAIATFALLQVLLFPPANDPLPFDLAVLVAMYSTVKYGRTMVDAYLAAATVATGIVIEVARHLSPNWWLLALFYVGVSGGVWLMAYTMRNRRLYVATLEERAATLERELDHLARIAAADERAAIARELHDVVAHSLSVMIVQADGGRYAFERDPELARRALSVVAATGRDALEDMRRLVAVLRSSSPPSQDPDEDRRRITLDQLDALVDGARSAGLAVRFTETGARPAPPAALPAAVELTVFRIVQEALTNVLRHAGPGADVALCLSYEPETVEVSVVDSGGLVPVGVVRPLDQAWPGHGLVGMRERIAVHSGQFEAGPLPEGGWSVSATVPRNHAGGPA